MGFEKHYVVFKTKYIWSIRTSEQNEKNNKAIAVMDATSKAKIATLRDMPTILSRCHSTLWVVNALMFSRMDQ